MTLRHLEIFSAVCAQESFTRAAEKLNMAQPAVSLAIRELEVFYNVRLFERMNRRVYLTEAGRTLRQYADTVLSQFQESVEVLRESGAQGACRFGVHVTLGETRLAGILTHLAEALPEITVRASIHNSRETERMILQNELDFAVVDNVTVSPHYLVEPLCGEELAAVCAPGYLTEKDSLSLAELAAERLLLRERGSAIRDTLDSTLFLANQTARPLWESVNSTALIQAAQAGLGITVLPDLLLAEPVARKRLRVVALDGVDMRNEMLAVRNRNQRPSRGLRVLLDAVGGITA